MRTIKEELIWLNEFGSIEEAREKDREMDKGGLQQEICSQQFRILITRGV